jgi:hypothetical protein
LSFASGGLITIVENLTMSSLGTLNIEGALTHVTVRNALRLLGLWFAYRVLLALYNVSPLHPLYRFPGPRLAAASFLYEAWYDLVKVGRYTSEIKTMHDKYGMSLERHRIGRASMVKLAKTAPGPIVRINPEELHCNDYNFVDEIYTSVGNRIRDKHPHFLAAFAGTLTVSTFATRDHEVCSCTEYTFFRGPLLTPGC